MQDIKIENKINYKQFFVNHLNVILLIISIIVFISSFCIGYFKLSVKDVVRVITNPIFHYKNINWVEEAPTIVWQIRMPRIIAGFLVGSSLSAAGAAYQCMFKNPLVSPDILGVSAGAGFGAALAITLELPYFYTQLFAFIFGIFIVFLSYSFSIKVKSGQTISLILAGTLFGTICSSATTLLKYIADPNDKLPSITFWLMGSLAKVQYEDLIMAIIPIIVGFSILFVLRWRLNLLTLDDQESSSLGINPFRLRLIVILASTLITASAICIAGLVGWVGLMVPHIARLIAGPQFEKLLPASIFIGGTFLLIVDNIARSVTSMDIPLGILTSILGAPFLLRLITQNRGD